MAFGIVVDGLPCYELLCFPPKVDRNQLLVAELGTVIIAQALFSFYKSAIIALANVQYRSMSLPSTKLFSSLLHHLSLFFRFLPRLTIDLHY